MWIEIMLQFILERIGEGLFIVLFLKRVIICKENGFKKISFRSDIVKKMF